jgi:Ca-activated chloride channel family protein
MRSWRSLWRNVLPPHVVEEIEVWFGVLIGLGALLMLYASLTAQPARAAEFPRDVGAGTLLFKSADGDYAPAAPLATDIRLSVAGIVARVRIAQRFTNSSAEFIEAVYALPLPDDAAVDRLSMRIGERVIEGEIEERQQAERTFDAARTAGQRTSLVRQTTANLFTTAVANIAPGEAIEITIEYLQTARYDAGEFSLRIPMTLTPRYGAPDTPEGLSARASTVLSDPTITLGSGFAAAAAGSSRHEAEVHAVLSPGVPLASIGSRGHEMHVTPSPGELYVLETVAPRVPLDRDLVIAWQPLAGSTPTVTTLTETLGDTTYALLMIVPPVTTHAATLQPREQIYVIDTSGSMGGASLAQAQTALMDALNRLTGADRFNVIQFNSVTSMLFAAPVAYTPANLAAAKRYVEGLDATGGTEIATAIAAALTQPTTSDYLRQVVFITDGAVGAETALFAAIERQLGDARLFTIGIGAAPNSFFMRKAAQFGRGTYTHIGATSEVAERMQALFAKLERVALSDVVLDWPDATELYPHAIPDVYAGEPLVLVASYSTTPGGPLATTAFGRAGNAPWQQQVRSHASTLPGIAALWARRKIEHLIDSRVAGADETLIRKLVLETALEHHLVSPYTSLVAVDKTPVRPTSAALERRDLRNAVPAGAQWTSAFAQTATPAPLWRGAGVLALLVAAVLGVRRRFLRARSGS